MPVIFSHSRFISFTAKTAAQQADIVDLRLWIAAAASWSVAAHRQSACGRPAATDGPQADWLD